MKLFDIILGRKKVSAQYRRDGSFVSRWARPPSRNTAEWLDMFSKSPRLAVVERIASDLANLTGHLYRVAPDGSRTEITNHPFLDLLDRPNPLYEMTSSAMWRLNEIYLMLVGESFMLIERDAYERPVELWNVPPHWVKMTPYLGNPGYLITSPSGLTMTVSVDDMFVMKQLNPLDPFMRGLGAAESVADEVEIDEYAAKFQKRFFYNDATPPFVFLIPGATKEQLDVFTADWEKKHRGVDKSHRMSALGGDVTIEKLGDAHGKDMGFLESRLAMRDAVLAHFGVPREIMGITENSNRATADAAQYIYAKNVLTPRVSSREKALNMQLLSMFGDDRLVWKFDPVIPYDKEFDKSRALEGWDAGLLTKNEARGLLDMPGIEGGDVYKTSITDLFLREGDDPVKVSQAILQPDLETADPVPGEKSLSMNITAMLRREEQAVRKHSKSFESAISRHFAEQRSAIQKALGISQKAEDTPAFDELSQYLLPDGTLDMDLWNALEEAEQLRIADSVAAGLLDWNAESKKLQAMFMPLWKEAYEAGVKLAEEYHGITNITRPEFVSVVKVNGAKHIVGIEQTTKDSIADIIADGIANGDSQAKLKKAIYEEMDTSHKRAKLIARQETMMSLATGQFDMMKAAGAKTKTWHHRPQKDPRDGTHGKVDHVSMEGETIPINKAFSNGLMYPRDPADGRPEEVINCRCYLTYAFDDDTGAGLKPNTAESLERSQPEAEPHQELLEAQSQQTMGEYIRADGTFDLNRAKTDYEKFLQSAPEKNRMYLQQALDGAEFERTNRPDVVFAYRAKRDAVQYNPEHPFFEEYNLPLVLTHELGHRIDRWFVHSAEQSEFVSAIRNAKAAFDKSPDLFIRFCKQKDKDGFLSDIMSAVCRGGYKLPAGHDAAYWTPDRQAKEIFTNLFALETYNDAEKLAFLKKHFPALMEAFNGFGYLV